MGLVIFGFWFWHFYTFSRKQEPITISNTSKLEQIQKQFSFGMMLQQLARKSLFLAPNLQHMTIHKRPWTAMMQSNTWLPTNDHGQRWCRTAKAFTLYMGWWQSVDGLWLLDGFATLNCSGFQRNDYFLMHCTMIFPTISSCSVKCHPDTLGLQCVTHQWSHPSHTHT